MTVNCLYPQFKETEMEKLKCPSVNWYPESFMGGTRKMTDKEVGIYIRALNSQFIEDGIEPDEYKEFPKRVQKKFCLGSEISVTIKDETYTPNNPSNYYNERMFWETVRKQNYSASRSQNRQKKSTDEEWENLSIEERLKIISK